MANNKKRWLTFEIFPDNPEQMNAFEWLKNANTCSGMYIKHDGENGGKDHYHVMVFEDNGINCKKQGENLVCESYAKRFGTYEFCEKDSKIYYKCRDELPEGCEWKTSLVIPVVFGVSDPNSLAHYFLHERYVDIREGKKLYSYSELKFWGNSERFKALYNTDDTNKIDIRGRVICCAKGCTSPHDIIEKAVIIGDWEIVEYIEKNPYFVKTFLLEGEKNGH